jgi:hypothetical protein
VGTAVILQEGIDHWLGGAAGFTEGDMVTVTSKGGGSYTVADMTSGATVTINDPIPLASGAVWWRDPSAVPRAGPRGPALHLPT